MRAWFTAFAAAALRLRGTHLRPRPVEDSYDIRTVQELVGHADVRTTMVYTCTHSRAAGQTQSRRPPLNRIVPKQLAARVGGQSRPRVAGRSAKPLISGLLTAARLVAVLWLAASGRGQLGARGQRRSWSLR